MPTCNDSDDIKICLQFFQGEAMVQWDNRALLTGGSRFESGWATIDLLPQCFSSSYKNSLLAFKSSSQIPHQSFHALTARAREMQRNEPSLNSMPQMVLEIFHFHFRTTT